MATAATFNVEARTPGKGHSKGLRNQRKVPAVIYGPKMENKNVLLDEIFVLKHSGSKHESTIFQTKSETSDINSLKVMLKKIDTHPATNRPIHVDLYALDMTATIKVNVSVDFQGEPVGVKEEGGVVNTILREIEIECNPTDIPDSIAVDISELKVGDSLHVSEVSFPAGIKPMTAPERTIVTVALPKEEKEEPVVEAAAEGAEGEAAPATDAAAAAPAEDKK